MLITLSLTCLLVVAFLNTLFGAELVGGFIDSTSGEGSVLVNATSTNPSDAVDVTFNLDPVEGVIVWIIVIVVLASIIGIRVFSSGLSDESIKTIIQLISFAGVWSAFSVLAYDLIVSIQIVGYMIYLILTIMYVVGVFKRFTGGGE